MLTQDPNKQVFLFWNIQLSRAYLHIYNTHLIPAQCTQRQYADNQLNRIFLTEITEHSWITVQFV